MAKVTVKVELDGNFFRHDPAKTFSDNVKAMLDALADEMEGIVKGEIAARAGSMPGYSGWTHDQIRGRTESVKGRNWSNWGVVSANTAGMTARDAIRTKAAAATIERRWHPFRRVKSAVYRSRAVIAADLTEGLN